MAPLRRHSAVVIRSSCQAYYMRAADWFFAAPGDGEFTVPSDKTEVLCILATSVDSKLAHLESMGSNYGFEHGFFLALRGKLLSGLVPSDSPESLSRSLTS